MTRDATGPYVCEADLVPRLRVHHFATVAPVLLARGERLFEDLGGVADGYAVTDIVCGRAVAHVLVPKRS